MQTIRVVLVVMVAGCSSDSTEPQTHASCKDKSCGASCTICAPGETGCNETAVEKYCQVDGSCSSQKPTCEDSYDACKGRACGASCTVCAPNDADCNETAVEKYCQVDGSCSATKPTCGQPCGDSVAAKEFEACRAAEDSRACIESGGDWARPGSSDRFTCICPTGEGNCPCKSSEDCLGGCTAPMSGMDFDACKELTEGTCVPSSPVGGCRCWFDADGVAMGACAD